MVNRYTDNLNLQTRTTCGKAKHELRVRSSDMWVTTWNPQFTSLYPQVTHWNQRVARSNPGVMSSDPRVTS